MAGPRQTREAQGEKWGWAGREEPTAQVHIRVVVACLRPCAGRHTCAHTGLGSACVQVHVRVCREVHMHICAAAHGMWGAGVHAEESGLCHSQLLTGPAGGDAGGHC